MKRGDRRERTILRKCWRGSAAGPGYRYTAARTEPPVPIGGYWSPAGTSEVKELPSFPDALVEWATKEFENAKPVRSRRDTLEAEYDLQARRGRQG